MNKIFIDTNFVMDLLARDGELQTMAINVMELVRRKDIQICVSFLSIANFAYITRKQNRESLYKNLEACCNLFTIIPNNSTQIINAMKLDFSDYEDALQYETALEEKCECIITRNQRDFSYSELPIYSPEEFLGYLGMA